MKPLSLAVVGHTNTGKTSLMRTLLRDSGFGEDRRVVRERGSSRDSHEQRGGYGDSAQAHEYPSQSGANVLRHATGRGAYTGCLRRMLNGHSH